MLLRAVSNPVKQEISGDCSQPAQQAVHCELSLGNSTIFVLLLLVSFYRCKSTGTTSGVASYANSIRYRKKRMLNHVETDAESRMERKVNHVENFASGSN